MSDRIADKVFAAIREREETESRFIDTALEILGSSKDPDLWPFQDVHFDEYDASFELDTCNAGLQLTPEQCQRFWNLGFNRCWLNLPNGTERHYWNGPHAPEMQGRLTRKTDGSCVEP